MDKTDWDSVFANTLSELTLAIHQEADETVIAEIRQRLQQSLQALPEFRKEKAGDTFGFSIK